MNIKELKASDFPGIDEAKFEEWKAIQLKANRDIWVALAVMVGGFLIGVPLIGGGIGYMVPVVAYFAYMLPKAFGEQARRRRELVRELDMNRRLSAKQRGREYSPTAS